MKSFRPHLADSGFTLAILVFLAVGIISYISALQLAEVRTSATHSFQILEAVARLDSNVSQMAEAAGRGALNAEYEQRVEQKTRIVERLRFLTDGDQKGRLFDLTAHRRGTHPNLANPSRRTPSGRINL